MRIPFRQGIIRWQTDSSNTPTFLAKSSQTGDYISLIVSPDPTIFTIAHGNANYTIEENKTVINAWGPFAPTGVTQYLYWDVSLLDASLTRGFTLYSPKFQNQQPPSPMVDQHWFDHTEKVMKVWNGGKWVPKLRLFVATYTSSAIIVPWQSAPGSQVSLDTPCTSGYIILGSDATPIRDRDGSLLTTETNLIVSRASNTPVKIETLLFFAQAREYIPKFSLVSLEDFRHIRLASSNEINKQVNGIILEDAHVSEVVLVTRIGEVVNEQWNWPTTSVGKPVFCGPSGQVTLTAPMTGIVQQIGFVTDKDHIFLHIHQPIRR